MLQVLLYTEGEPAKCCKSMYSAFIPSASSMEAAEPADPSQWVWAASVQLLILKLLPQLTSLGCIILQALDRYLLYVANGSLEHGIDLPDACTSVAG